MKSEPEPVNGPDAMARLDVLVRKVLTVPHAEIMRREGEYKRKSDANPSKRGPKRKP